MDSRRLLARATLRVRWRGLVAAGVLAGLVGGGLIVAVQLARRTSTAFDRRAAESRLEDLELTSFYGRDTAEAASRLEGVEHAWVGTSMVGRIRGEALRYITVLAGPARGDDLARQQIVEGRPADPTSADEVVVDARALRASNRQVGDTLELDLLTYQDFLNFDTGFGRPHGPSATVRIVGATRQWSDDSTNLVEATPAFEQRYAPGVAGPNGEQVNDVLLRLRDGSAGVARYRRQLDRATIARRPSTAASEVPAFQVLDPRQRAEPVVTAARVIVTGLMIALGVAALAGGTAVVQVLIRRHALDEPTRQVERALGMTMRDQGVVRAMTAVLPAGVAAATASAVGSAASGVEPPGVLAAVEPSPGAAPNAVVLVLGAVLVAASVLALDRLAFVVVARARGHRHVASRSSLAAAASVVGPAVETGVDLAFDRRDRRSAVASRSARIGAVIGVTGVVAALVFASSLHRLGASPDRWGWRGDAMVADVRDDTVAQLLEDRRVDALSDVQSTSARVDGEEVKAYAFDMRRGSLGWTVLDGRQAAGPDEVLVGTRVARRQELAVGDSVRLGGANGSSRRVEVVGLGVGPKDDEDLGDAVVLTPEGLERSRLRGSYRGAYLSVRPGTLAAFLADHRSQLEIDTASRPPEVSNLASLGILPIALGGFVALIGIGALANALVVTTQQRRRDLGSLRAMGMTGRQVRWSIVVAGTSIAVVGVLIGLPLGIAVGGSVWRLVASTGYVAGDPALHIALVIVPFATVALGAALSLFPAYRATRHLPGWSLRSE